MHSISKHMWIINKVVRFCRKGELCDLWMLLSSETWCSTDILHRTAPCACAACAGVDRSSPFPVRPCSDTGTAQLCFSCWTSTSSRPRHHFFYSQPYCSSCSNNRPLLLLQYASPIDLNLNVLRKLLCPSHLYFLYCDILYINRVRLVIVM